MRIMVDANLLVKAIFYGSEWITDFLIDYAPKNNTTQDYLSLVEEIIEED